VTVAVAVAHDCAGGVVYASVAVEDGKAEEAEPVPFSCFARFWNAVNECGSGSAGALIANTIPWPQCPVCSQWNQNGVSPPATANSQVSRRAVTFDSKWLG
jgi:hypothetical protein